MKIDFWISILVAIPLAITANLLTPWMSHWLDVRAEKGRYRKREKTVKAREASRKRLQAELAEVDAYRADPARLHSLLLDSILRCITYGAVGTAYLTLGYATFNVFLSGNHTVGFIRTVRLVTLPALQLFVVIVNMVVFTIGMRAVRISRRVRNYDIWRQTMENEIGRHSEVSSDPTPTLEQQDNA